MVSFLLLQITNLELIEGADAETNFRNLIIRTPQLLQPSQPVYLHRHLHQVVPGNSQTPQVQHVSQELHGNPVQADRVHAEVGEVDEFGKRLDVEDQVLVSGNVQMVQRGPELADPLRDSLDLIGLAVESSLQEENY